MKLGASISTLALLLQVAAAETILYDGTLGTLPASQGWAYIASPLASASQTIIGGAVRLDTTPVISDLAGYFGHAHPSLPNLDRAAGFTVCFDAQLHAETHANTNRAGFSIIAIASDLGAIEIGMWTNEIWAQSDSPLFTHAESVAFDTTATTNAFALTMYKDTYTLAANGVDILSGPVRDYTAFGGFPDPYETPNFLFLGDDTSSAAARFDLARVCVSLLPHLELLAGDATSVMLSVSNLETGMGFDIERSHALPATKWAVADSFTATGSVTTWSGPWDIDATQSYLRVIGSPP